MANVYFYYNSKKERGNLTVRIKHKKEIDYRLATNIITERNYWITSTGKRRTLKDLAYSNNANAKRHKQYLDDFRERLLKQFNHDYNNGIPISREWLRSTVESILNIISDKEGITQEQKRIDEENAKEIAKEKERQEINLLSTAISNVINHEYYNNKGQQSKYRNTLKKLKEYEKDHRAKIKVVDVNQGFMDRFMAFLELELKYQFSTSRKTCQYVNHAVRYQKNAYPKIVELSETFNNIRYKRQSNTERRKTREEIIVTLSPNELDIIFNTNVPKRLINAKKAILFGSETGLRVSDYNKLSDENIKNIDGLDYWSLETKKTPSDVCIPITGRIKTYIKEYGKPKTDYKGAYETILNREIKEVCKIAGIDGMIQARKSVSMTVRGKEVRRTVSSEYPKHEVITNHSLRRSFATNYYTLIPLRHIQLILGHSSEKQTLEYINEARDQGQTVRIIAEAMEKAHQEHQERSKLRIVKRNQ